MMSDNHVILKNVAADRCRDDIYDERKKGAIIFVPDEISTGGKLAFFVSENQRVAVNDGINTSYDFDLGDASSKMTVYIMDGETLMTTKMTAGELSDLYAHEDNLNAAYKADDMTLGDGKVSTEEEKKAFSDAVQAIYNLPRRSHDNAREDAAAGLSTEKDEQKNFGE